MAPELFNSLEAAELRQLAAQVRDHQEAKKISDSALVRKFADLGSTKTFTRILAGDLAELDLERQLANYRSVWALIEASGDEAGREEELYDDLKPARELKRAFLSTMKEKGNARLILVEGDTGSGKTSARRLLIGRYGTRLLLIEATVAWADKPSAMLGAILTATGEKELPPATMDRFNRVVEKLNLSRRALIIEEAHHLGVRLLNLLKTLINSTPGEFILLAYPTLWARLTKEAYHEVRQLAGNRLAERIDLSEITTQDVGRILEKRVPGIRESINGDWKSTVEALHTRAKIPKHGNLAFVRDVCARLCEMADGTAGPEQKDVFAAIEKEVASR